MMKRGDHVTTSEVLAYLDITDIDEKTLSAWRYITDTGQRRLDPATDEPEVVWRNRGIASYQRMLKTKRIISYHEAGHAVASFVLGGRKVRQIIVRNRLWRTHGIVWYDSAFTGRSAKAKDREIIVSLAGPLAERRYSPKSHWRRGAGGDFKHIRKLIGEGEDADRYLRDAEARAEQFVAEHWDKITRLAKALSQNVRDIEMSGEEMEAILSLAG
jgi:hypothetical protein